MPSHLRVLDALNASAERLRQLVEALEPAQLDAHAYPTEWSVADVLSHLGSAAVIFEHWLEDGLAGREISQDFAPAVWAEWNAKSSAARAVDSLAADRHFIASLEGVDDEGRKGFRFAMGPFDEDFEGFVALRLSEHTLHSWDIAVAFDSTATLDPDAAGLILGRLELMARYAGKPSGTEQRLSVHTTEPERDFEFTLGPDAVSIAPSGASSQPDVALPAEALVRLVYGRLDPAHTPEVRGAEHLDALRAVFPGR
jgi:uncharacterized protein (TIGR03083 family)